MANSLGLTIAKLLFILIFLGISSARRRKYYYEGLNITLSNIYIYMLYATSIRILITNNLKFSILF